MKRIIVQLYEIQDPREAEWLIGLGVDRIGSVILAGGISPENVFDAIGRVKPAGIDSCTQTNTRDHGGRPIRFRKDFDRVSRLLDEVRRAEEVYSNLRPSAL